MRISLKDYLEKIDKEKVKVVTLSSYDIDAFPLEILNFTWIEELYFGNCYKYKEQEFLDGGPCTLKELPSDLVNLKNLKKLSLNGGIFGSPICDISDFGILGELQNLESLYLSSTELNDISFVKNLPKLKDLQINSTKVVDFSPLSNLTSLESLALCENNLNDLSFLSHTTSLIAIQLASNDLINVNSLKGNKGLKRICVCTNNSININKLLENHEQLEEVCNTSGYTLEAVKPHKELKRIVVSERTTNVEFRQLEKYHQLEECTISNIDEKVLDVSSLVNVSELDLSGSFNKVIGLEKLTKLKWLCISSDILSQIEIPENLKDLRITECTFSDLSLINNLDNLESLSINSTEVTDLSPLTTATNLIQLDIEFNSINSLKPIVHLIKDGLEIEFAKTDIPFEVLELYEDEKIDELIQYYQNSDD